MCLMLYLGTLGVQPLFESPALRVEEVDPQYEAVRQWFSHPNVRFVGAHTGCSCGFPSVVAEEPIEYWDGMFSEERDDDLKSVRALLDLLRQHLLVTGHVELYPVWNGEEALPPKGTIAMTFEALTPDTFFFNERFFYRVSRADIGPRQH